MKHTDKPADNVQGTVTAQQFAEQGLKKLGRAVSETYTLKSFKKILEKIENLKMVTPEELKQLQAIHKTLVERWIARSLF